jgi:catechol 2,3-dioxygenase-like lactoylglutathione lyase family enzyme
VTPFKTLGHFNLKVRDLQASIDFYTAIGFPEFLRLTEEDGSPWIVYMRITDELYVELLPGGKGMAGDQVATGLNHLCLTTDDIEATVALLNKSGIPLTTTFEPNHRGVDGNRGVWIADPDGNRIEIMEMAPNCAQYEAIAAWHRNGKSTALLRPLKPRKAD